VTDRSATATIKGYFYQFDQTIVRLLEASSGASIIVEGVEDIDLDDGDESAFVQCKYYEGTEYNHSVIKDAIILMLRHFHAAGCPRNQTFKYRLYGHYKGGQNKLVLPLSDAFLKANFLTYTQKKVEHRVYEELGLTAHDISTFASLLEIDINALSYEDQQQKLNKLLIAAIPDSNVIDVESFFYPAAINVIQKLAVELDEKRRKIIKEDFLKSINRKEIIFSVWLQQKFGADYYAKMIRRKFFNSKTTKMPIASRIFIIDMNGVCEAQKAAGMLAKLGDFFSHKEHARTPPQDRFCPYVLLRGITSTELIKIKAELWDQGVRFSEGYPYQGADFSEKLLVDHPTKENLWRLKFIPSEAKLISTVSAISGSIIEIYDFYQTMPLDPALVPKEKIYHPIRSSSSYFVQEVMQA